MKILICSDGTSPADSAIRIGGLLIGPTHAKTTLVGIAENPQDERPLRDALEAQARSLRAHGVAPEIVVREGEPIRQILIQTSEKTYEVIKLIPPPVLVAIGECTTLKKFLVCTGGKEFIEEAVQLTGKLAAAVGASVTLLHVMAEPPAIYADLVQMEEDVDRLLESKSELGINLRTQKQDLEKLGVPTEVHVRHGIVVDQVFAEVRKSSYEVIVTGSSQARGMLRHYIMGDLTLRILNHANCPVLVARAGKVAGPRGLWRSIRRAFAASQSGSVA